MHQAIAEEPGDRQDWSAGRCPVPYAGLCAGRGSIAVLVLARAALRSRRDWARAACAFSRTNDPWTRFCTASRSLPPYCRSHHRDAGTARICGISSGCGLVFIAMAAGTGISLGQSVTSPVVKPGRHCVPEAGDHNSIGPRVMMPSKHLRQTLFAQQPTGRVADDRFTPRRHAHVPSPHGDSVGLAITVRGWLHSERLAAGRT